LLCGIHIFGKVCQDKGTRISGSSKNTNHLCAYTYHVNLLNGRRRLYTEDIGMNCISGFASDSEMSMEQKCSFRNSSNAARQEAANALELKPPNGLSPQSKPTVVACCLAFCLQNGFTAFHAKHFQSVKQKKH
jgi:hypothetical protein